METGPVIHPTVLAGEITPAGGDELQLPRQAVGGSLRLARLDATKQPLSGGTAVDN